MERQSPAGIAERQRAFFHSGATRDIAFRRSRLIALRDAIQNRESDILDSLAGDLGRAAAEAYTVENAIVLNEIAFALRHLRSWSRQRRVSTPLGLFPGSSGIRPEPLGCALIIAPWNYPFQLAISPLVAALAAGNCAVVKPSELSPNTARVVADLIRDTFEPEHVTAVEGGKDETEALLDQRFDTILFTGSAPVGRIVMAAAARHLTPVTLELGGKNPCIVEADAEIETAARRIAWGKYLNTGQTCIAPDFLLVHEAVKPAFLSALKASIEAFYGKDPHVSPDYGRIINDGHFARLGALLTGDIVVGGESDPSDRYIAPTVIDNVGWDDAIMEDEIFGPILPVIAYDNLDRVIERLEAWPKPLALYVFSTSRATQEKLLGRIPSGGACINDVLSQMGNVRLPFGGVGQSGIGAYHGKTGFDTFSHARGIVWRANWWDPRIRYAPYWIPVAALRRLLPFLY